MSLTMRLLLSLSVTLAVIPYSVCAAQFQNGEVESLSGYGVEHSGEIDGLKYTYVFDLSGELIRGSIDGPESTPGIDMNDPDRWEISPQRDKITDTVKWYAFHHKTGLMLRLTPTGHVSTVCVMYADFPGRPIAVRVGKLPAMRFEEECSSKAASVLGDQLMKGGRLITRGYEWPYDYPKDKEGSSNGFPQLIKLYFYLKKNY